MSYDVSFVLRRVERDMSTKGELARRRAVDGMRSDYAEAARRFGLCPSLHAFARLRAAAAALLENGGHDACGEVCDESGTDTLYTQMCGRAVRMPLPLKAR